MSLLSLPRNVQEIVAGLDSFLAAEVIGRQRRYSELFESPSLIYDSSGRYTEPVQELRRKVRRSSAEAGYYQMCVPAELGGGGEGALTWFACWEHTFHTLGMKHSILGHEVIAHWSTGPSLLLTEASPEVKAAAVPGLLSGDRTLCFAMSEPEAGSDIYAMATRATRDGDDWVITGTKQWITNGPYADYAIVFAVTDQELARAHRGGVSAFFVPTTTPGFSVDSIIKLYGHSGGFEGIISFDNIRVPAPGLLGARDRGLDLGLAALALGRLFNAAKSVGLTRWALDNVVPYARERRTFGKTLLEHQATSFMLADGIGDVLSAHLLGLHAARLRDGGEDALMETSMAKLRATEMACRVLDNVVQVYGAMGLTNEIGVAEAWQEVRTVRIADGSSEMLRRIIAGRLARAIPEL